MEVEEQVNVLYRQLSGKLVTSLVSYFGLNNLQVAEDIVQETFIAALEQWKLKGLPDKPDAWLFKVCKNKTLNALERKSAQPAGPYEFADEEKIQYHLDQLFLDHEIKDNQLRLLFACCHPALSPKSQVILIVKSICGLRTDEIARGLAMTEEAVTKAHTRSRQTLSEEKINLRVPFLLRSSERLNSVHTAIYLLFNEGYQSSDRDALIRKELCIEAMRLTRAILEIPEVRTTDTYALMALMSFHSSRFDSRFKNGEIIALEDQDRSKWDSDLIRLGNEYFKKTIGSKPTRYILEAAIASLHASSSNFESTDWKTIARLYQQLQAIHESPFVDLNYAIAVYYNSGMEEALKLLQTSNHLNWLTNYYLYHAFMGKMLESENKNAARAHYQRAHDLTNHASEKNFLEKRIARLS